MRGTGLALVALTAAVLTLAPASAQEGTSNPGGCGEIGEPGPPGAPAITDLRLDPDEFIPARRRTPLGTRGTTIRFSLSEPGTVDFRVRRDPPRTNGGPPPRHSHRFSRELEAGEQAVRFTGTLDGRTFAPGTYVLYVCAVDDAGIPSERGFAPFAIASRRVGGGCALQPLANCSGADLSGMDLRGRDLHGANFSNVNLSRADIRGANLSGTNLWQANLSSIKGDTFGDQKPTDLTYAGASGANLRGASLTGAKMPRASFTRASVRFISAWDANLTGASFSGADLSGSGLLGASLQGAGFEYTNLAGASLTNATGFEAGITTYLCSTRMPDGATNDRDCHRPPPP